MQDYLLAIKYAEIGRLFDIHTANVWLSSGYLIFVKNLVNFAGRISFITKQKLKTIGICYFCKKLYRSAKNYFYWSSLIFVNNKCLDIIEMWKASELLYTPYL